MNATAAPVSDATPSTPAAESAATSRTWTPDQVAALSRLVTNPTVRALMELTSQTPGERVTFEQVYQQAGRPYAKARADLAGFTRLLRHQFDRTDWPVRATTGAKGQLEYSASPAVAAAWKSASATSPTH